MKKLSSIWFMWIAFGLGVIAVLMMFVPTLKVGGITHNATTIFFNNGSGTVKGAWTAFVGYMLILVAAIGSGVMALPFVQPSVKGEKIVLISIIAAFVIGAVLVLTVGVIYSALNHPASLTLLAGPYLAGIFSLLCGASIAIALKKDW